MARKTVTGALQNTRHDYQENWKQCLVCNKYKKTVTKSFGGALLAILTGKLALNGQACCSFNERCNLVLKRCFGRYVPRAKLQDDRNEQPGVLAARSGLLRRKIGYLPIKFLKIISDVAHKEGANQLSARKTGESSYLAILSIKAQNQCWRRANDDIQRTKSYIML